MAAIFKVSPDTDGCFQFEFINSKGELILHSPTFENMELLDKAIQGVRVGSLMSQFISRDKTPEGEFTFRISDQNGDTIATSIPFDNELVFNNALHSVRESASIAGIEHTAA